MIFLRIFFRFYYAYLSLIFFKYLNGTYFGENLIWQMATFFLNIYRFLFQAAEKILLRLGALHKRKMKSGLLFKELYILKYFVDYGIETFKLICFFEVFITPSQKSENIQHN